MENETYNATQAHEAQTKYCKEKGVPHFAPPDICWSCHTNIYMGDRGISVEQASKTLVTGCPYCHRSYCD